MDIHGPGEKTNEETEMRKHMSDASKRKDKQKMSHRETQTR